MADDSRPPLAPLPTPSDRSAAPADDPAPRGSGSSRPRGPTLAADTGRANVLRRRAAGHAGLALREMASLGAVLLVVAAVVAALLWPWLAGPPIGGDRLARFAPLRDGDARLIVRTAGDGSVRGWAAQNTRLVAGLRIYTDLRKHIGDGFVAAAARPGENGVPDGELHERLGRMVVQELRTRELDFDGNVTDLWQYLARDERGERLVALYYPQSGRELVADPPALTLPADPAVGQRWEASGRLGTGRYSLVGHVAAADRRPGPGGQPRDCLQVELEFAVAVGASPSGTRSRDWYCDGVGWVAGELLDGNGSPRQRSRWAASAGPDEPLPLPPPGPLLGARAPPGPPDSWSLIRLGRSRATGETSEATILPTWLPTDPPLVLAAGFGGELVAFDARAPGDPPRWRFHVDGTIYGQPAFDAATGRIYVGASDKRLYALDARGLVLWSAETADNVAARPLAVGPLVVAAGEDGTVYGLDADSGRERWTFAGDGGIVSWPVLADGTVIVGSDAGTVHGIGPDDGSRRWSFRANGPVEAPVAFDQARGVAYVASRDGTLAAFRPAECPAAARTCDTVWSAEPGGALRGAPLVVGDLVLVVDEERELIAVRADDGRRAWSLGGGFVGAPILVGDSVLAATRSGTVELLAPTGERLAAWDANVGGGSADGPASFAYGPVLGGDAIWTADTNAVVRRLGAPLDGTLRTLPIAWIDQSTRPPFAGVQLRHTIVEYRGLALAVDFQGSLFALDPATGRGSNLAPPGNSVVTQVDPTLAGDLLLTVSGRTLQALDLRTGQPAWRAVAPGTVARPPVVAGGAAVWATAGDDGASLQAVDAATGAPRWQASLGRVAQVGGVVAGSDVAFTAVPTAAWDLATGALRWRVDLPGLMVGGPALSADGGVLYVAGLRPDGSHGFVASLDATTGSTRWLAEIPDAVLAPLDRLWLDDGLVIVPDLGGKVVALDAETGTERWRFAPPAARLGNVTVGRGVVWFMLENARLYGLDLRTGRPIARLVDLELNLNGAGLTQRPALIGDRLLFPSDLIVVGVELPSDLASERP